MPPLGGPVIVPEIEPCVMPVLIRNKPHPGVGDVVVFVVVNKHLFVN